MVVNYDLPLMNERGKSSNDEQPDLETYIHRIGGHLIVDIPFFKTIGLALTTLLFLFSGRTGRFGRKGISINFVHDQRTWLQMEQIEKLMGRKIMRIDTSDIDEMEEVRFLFFLFIFDPTGMSIETVC